MSECLSPGQIFRFKDAIVISGFSPKIQKSFIERSPVALSLVMKNSFLKELQKSKCSSDFTYIDILNTQLTAFQIRTSDRLENRFVNICSKVTNHLRKGIGARRFTFLEETVSVAIYESELFNVSQLSQSVEHYNQERFEIMKKCSELHDSLTEILGKCSDLQIENNALKIDQNCSASANTLCIEQVRQTNEDNRKLRQETDSLKDDLITIQTQLHYSKKHDEKLEADNIKLFEYVKELETKCIKQTDSKTPKTLKLFKSEAERALWFAESFGLLPESLNCRTVSGASQHIKFSHLNTDDKDRLHDLVYILDRFSVSNAAYYELSMFDRNLPRKYLVAQEREKLNSLFHIERCPGNVPGAYVSLKNEIISHIKQSNINPNETLKVKVSGDGARMSRVTNFVTLSVSFPDSEKCVSSQNIKALAILKCNEKYEELKVCASPVLEELNELITSKQISVEDSTYKLDVYFGGDMKFVDICLGINGPSANYACPWCHVHKDERVNLTRPVGFYESNSMKRTASNIQENAERSIYGCKNIPLVKIDPSKVIPDELHMMMRISDILLKNLIDDCKQQDSKLEVLKEPTHHLKDLVTNINECGVPFHIWSEKNSTEIQWTSLTGKAHKQLMQRLPDKLLFVIANDTHEHVIKLWRDFYEIFSTVVGNEADTVQKDEVFRMTQQWGMDFLSLGKRGRIGYDKITPYMHCFIYHVPNFVNSIGSLSRFSGQGIEKLNDDIKSVHLKRTNKSDQTVDDLATRKRLEFLSANQHDRQKRDYTKWNVDFWESEKGIRAANKRKKIVSEINNAHQQFQQISEERSFEEMSDRELKEKLKSLGVLTKVRKREKLIDLILKARDSYNEM